MRMALLSQIDLSDSKHWLSFQFQNLHKAIIIKTVWYWHQDRHKDQWDRIESLEMSITFIVILNESVNPKGNQSWIFIGRTDAEAETPIFWPPDVKNWLIGKDTDAGKDWRQEEKGMTEDEMVEWHHQLDGHEFEQAWGVGDGQGSLACCSSWDHKESDTTERLNWTDLQSSDFWWRYQDNLMEKKQSFQ